MDKRILDFLEQLVDIKFYGRITLIFEAGRIVDIQQVKAIKPWELGETRGLDDVTAD